MTSQSNTRPEEESEPNLDDGSRSAGLNEVEANFEETPTQPSQFRISDLLALMMLTAAILMVATAIMPLVPSFSAQLPVPAPLLIIGILYFDLSVIVYTGHLTISKRKVALAKAGRFLGKGIVGEWRWKHWATIKSWILLFLFTSIAFIMILGLGMQMEVIKPLHWFGILAALSWNGIYSAIFLGTLTYWVLRYTWRLHPGSIEFFDEGVILGGIELIAWTDVSIRPSTVYTDRFVIVARLVPKGNQYAGVSKRMYVVQAEPALRAELLATKEGLYKDDAVKS